MCEIFNFGKEYFKSIGFHVIGEDLSRVNLSFADNNSSYSYLVSLFSERGLNWITINSQFADGTTVTFLKHFYIESANDFSLVCERTGLLTDIYKG